MSYIREAAEQIANDGFISDDLMAQMDYLDIVEAQRIAGRDEASE